MYLWTFNIKTTEETRFSVIGTRNIIHKHVILEQDDGLTIPAVSQYYPSAEHNTAFHNLCFGISERRL